ncbi:MAG: hypothetical protein ABL958_17475, partial [Bdellovibrionia bacterium]
MQNRRVTLTALLLLAIMPLPLFFNSCSASSPGTVSSETVAGNPAVELAVSPFLSAADTDGISICIGRIDLVKSSGGSVSIGRPSSAPTVLSQAGSKLLDTNLSVGTYSGLTLTLDDSCTGGTSAQITNSTGTYSTSESI